MGCNDPFDEAKFYLAKLQPKCGWRDVNNMGVSHKISTQFRQIVVNLQPLENFSVVFYLFLHCKKQITVAVAYLAIAQA